MQHSLSMKSINEYILLIQTVYHSQQKNLNDSFTVSEEILYKIL